jgi:hypothetical protein
VTAKERAEALESLVDDLALRVWQETRACEAAVDFSAARTALLTAIADDRRAAEAAAYERAAREADRWFAQYPEDVFPPDSPSLEAKAAGHGRHVAKCIAGDIRSLATKRDE